MHITAVAVIATRNTITKKHTPIPMTRSKRSTTIQVVVADTITTTKAIPMNTAPAVVDMITTTKAIPMNTALAVADMTMTTKDTITVVAVTTMNMTTVTIMADAVADAAMKTA